MTIKVALEHRTAYAFDRPVKIYPHVVRLRPAPHSRTPIEAYSLAVEPAGHFLNWQQDAFSNYQARLVFPEPSTTLSITVSLVADLTAITYEGLADPTWKGGLCLRAGQHPYNTALFSAFMTHHDAAATEEWLTGLKANLARKAGGGDRDGAKDILGGICDIAVASSYVG